MTTRGWSVLGFFLQTQDPPGVKPPEGKGFLVRRVFPGGSFPMRSDVQVIEVRVARKRDHPYSRLGSRYGYTVNGIEGGAIRLVPGREYILDIVTNGDHPFFFHNNPKGGPAAIPIIPGPGDVFGPGAEPPTDGRHFFRVPEAWRFETSFGLLYYACLEHPYMGGPVEIVGPEAALEAIASALGSVGLVGVAPPKTLMISRGSLRTRVTLPSPRVHEWGADGPIPQGMSQGGAKITHASLPDLGEIEALFPPGPQGGRIRLPEDPRTARIYLLGPAEDLDPDTGFVQGGLDQEVPLGLPPFVAGAPLRDQTLVAVARILPRPGRPWTFEGGDPTCDISFEDLEPGDPLGVLVSVTQTQAGPVARYVCAGPLGPKELALTHITRDKVIARGPTLPSPPSRPLVHVFGVRGLRTWLVNSHVFSEAGNIWLRKEIEHSASCPVCRATIPSVSGVLGTALVRGQTRVLRAIWDSYSEGELDVEINPGARAFSHLAWALHRYDLLPRVRTRSPDWDILFGSARRLANSEDLVPRSPGYDLIPFFTDTLSNLSWPEEGGEVLVRMMRSDLVVREIFIKYWTPGLEPEDQANRAKNILQAVTVQTAPADIYLRLLGAHTVLERFPLHSNDPWTRSLVPARVAEVRRLVADLLAKTIQVDSGTPGIPPNWENLIPRRPKGPSGIFGPPVPVLLDPLGVLGAALKAGTLRVPEKGAPPSEATALWTTFWPLVQESMYPVPSEEYLEAARAQGTEAAVRAAWPSLDEAKGRMSIPLFAGETPIPKEYQDRLTQALGTVFLTQETLVEIVRTIATRELSSQDISGNPSWTKALGEIGAVIGSPARVLIILWTIVLPSLGPTVIDIWTARCIDGDIACEKGVDQWIRSFSGLNSQGWDPSTWKLTEGDVRDLEGGLKATLLAATQFPRSDFLSLRLYDRPGFSSRGAWRTFNDLTGGWARAVTTGVGHVLRKIKSQGFGVTPARPLLTWWAVLVPASIPDSACVLDTGCEEVLQQGEKFGNFFVPLGEAWEAMTERDQNVILGQLIRYGLRATTEALIKMSEGLQFWANTGPTWVRILRVLRDIEEGGIEDFPATRSAEVIQALRSRILLPPLVQQGIQTLPMYGEEDELERDDPFPDLGSVLIRRENPGGGTRVSGLLHLWLEVVEQEMKWLGIDDEKMPIEDAAAITATWVRRLGRLDRKWQVETLGVIQVPPDRTDDDNPLFWFRSLDSPRYWALLRLVVHGVPSSERPWDLGWSVPEIWDMVFNPEAGIQGPVLYDLDYPRQLDDVLSAWRTPKPLPLEALLQLQRVGFQRALTDPATGLGDAWISTWSNILRSVAESVSTRGSMDLAQEIFSTWILHLHEHLRKGMMNPAGGLARLFDRHAGGIPLTLAVLYTLGGEPRGIWEFSVMRLLMAGWWSPEDIESRNPEAWTRIQTRREWNSSWSSGWREAIRRWNRTRPRSPSPEGRRVRARQEDAPEEEEPSAHPTANLVEITEAAAQLGLVLGPDYNIDHLLEHIRDNGPLVRRGLRDPRIRDSILRVMTEAFEEENIADWWMYLEADQAEWISMNSAINLLDLGLPFHLSLYHEAIRVDTGLYTIRGEDPTREESRKKDQFLVLLEDSRDAFGWVDPLPEGFPGNRRIFYQALQRAPRGSQDARDRFTARVNALHMFYGSRVYGGTEGPAFGDASVWFPMAGLYVAPGVIKQVGSMGAYTQSLLLDPEVGREVIGATIALALENSTPEDRRVGGSVPWGEFIRTLVGVLDTWGLPGDTLREAVREEWASLWRDGPPLGEDVWSLIWPRVPGGDDISTTEFSMTQDDANLIEEAFGRAPVGGASRFE